MPLSTGGPGSLTPYAFTGQWLDADTGLQYHRARWLNCATANWLSIDPVFDFPGNFGSRYGYVGSNPLLYTDSLGLFTLVEALSSVKIMASLGALTGFTLGVCHGLSTGASLGGAIMLGLLYAAIGAMVGALFARWPSPTTTGTVNGMTAAWQYEHRYRGNGTYAPWKTALVFVLNFAASFGMALLGGRMTAPDLGLIRGAGVTAVLAVLNAFVAVFVKAITWEISGDTPRSPEEWMYEMKKTALSTGIASAITVGIVAIPEAKVDVLGIEQIFNGAGLWFGRLLEGAYDWFRRQRDAGNEE